MARRVPPPTVDYIMACYRNKMQERPEVRLRQLIWDIRALTQMQHTIDIPAEYKRTTKEIRTPFMRDAWLRIAAAITRNDWQLHINPIRGTDASKRATSIAERWVKAAAKAMDIETNETTFYEAGKALVRDGESVLKIVPRAKAWANIPQYPARRGRRNDPATLYETADDYLRALREFKRGAPFPIVWRVVDRLQMVFGDGEYGDDWAIEYGEYPRPLLMQRYGLDDDGDDTLPTDDDQKVTPEDTLGGRPVPEGYAVSGFGGVSRKLEFWSNNHYAVVIDGKMAPGFPTRNPIGCIPYARGRSDSDPEPVLYGLLYLVPALDSALTMWSNWMHLGAFPNPTLNDVPNAQNLPIPAEFPTGQPTQPTTFTWSPGKMLVVPRGKQFSFMTPPGIGSDIRDMVVLLQQFISVAGISNIMRGTSLSGDSGYLASQMIEAAELTYRRLGSAQERQMSRAVQLMFHIVEKQIKQSVYVPAPTPDGRAYLSLTPDPADLEVNDDEIAYLGDLGSVEVTVRPDMSAVQQARAMIARQIVSGPPGERLDSQRHAMEYWMGYEDPDTIIDEIYAEEALSRSPEMLQLVMQEALRRAGVTPPMPSTAAVPGMGGGAPETPVNLPGQVAGGAPNLSATVAPTGPAAGAGNYPGAPPNPVPMAPGGMA